MKKLLQLILFFALTKGTHNMRVESHKVVPIHFSGSLTKSCRSSSERTQAPANEEARAN